MYQIERGSLHFSFDIRIPGVTTSLGFHTWLLHTTAAGTELFTTVTLSIPKIRPSFQFYKDEELETVQNSDEFVKSNPQVVHHDSDEMVEDETEMADKV